MFCTIIGLSHQRKRRIGHRQGSVSCFCPDRYQASQPDFGNTVHKLRDLLQKLLYETHEDLDNIQKTLESLGVDVVRLHPNLTQAATLAETTTHGVGYSNIMEYYEEQKSAFNGIPKPALMPRDYLITMGNKILLTQQYPEFHKFMTSSGQNFINPDCLDMRLTVDPKNRKLLQNLIMIPEINSVIEGKLKE